MIPRRAALAHVENEEVRSFWRDEYAGYSPAFRTLVAAPLQNKLGAVLTDPRMKRIFTGRESSFDVRKVMDQGGVLPVNLSKGAAWRKSAGEKVVSLFEDHTDILRKDRRETLYGHKICLTSGASSMILDCLILEGNPADSSLADTMIERQVGLYGRAQR